MRKDNVLFYLLLVLAGFGLWWLINWLLTKGVMYVVMEIWGIALPFWATFVGVAVISTIFHQTNIQLKQ